MSGGATGVSMTDLTVTLGGVKLTSLDAGECLYDGGAMFGAVPKIIWEALVPADDQNRIRLSLSPLLIETDGRKILVDVGFGARHTKKDLRIFAFDPDRNVETALRRMGFAPEDIDTVVLTHLHADHAAGATRDGTGGVEPAFPNACYHVNEREWADALEPDARSRAAYRTDDFVPIEEAGQLDLVGDRHEVAPGVTMVRTGGHTAGHTMVLIETPDGTAVYPADLIPGRHHVRVPYVAGVDTFPLEVIEQKEKLLAQAVAGDWIVILDHDVDGNVGRITKDERGRYAFEDLSDA
jgi:glyoxylase-like metal-dependent hydrolase (beta-lactamase superfamily II)